MGTYELAIAGLVGSGIGALLGTPLLWPRSDRRPEVAAFGAAALLLAAIAGLISARLAGLVPDAALTGHVINLVGIGACLSALTYVWLTTGHGRPPAALLLSPVMAYAALAALSGAAGARTVVPFAWLLPVVLGLTAATAWALYRAAPPSAPPLVPPAAVVAFLAVVNLAQILRMDLGHVPAVRAVVPLVAVMGFAATVALMVYRQARSGAGAAAPATGPPAAAVEPAVYERSGLDDAAAHALLTRVYAALDRDRLFARPDLSLAALAQAVGSTPHLVSEALNRVGGRSFRDVVTERRLADVKAQLDDPANDRYTIEGLGLSAGFRSRSALYDAFRRFEGTTPTAYRDARRRGVT